MSNDQFVVVVVFVVDFLAVVVVVVVVVFVVVKIKFNDKFLRFRLQQIVGAFLKNPTKDSPSANSPA
jgi:hypothetical protein